MIIHGKINESTKNNQIIKVNFKKGNNYAAKISWSTKSEPDKINTRAT